MLQRGGATDRSSAVAACILAIGLALASCSGSGDDDSAEGQVAPTSTTSRSNTTTTALPTLEVVDARLEFWVEFASDVPSGHTYRAELRVNAVAEPIASEFGIEIRGRRLDMSDAVVESQDERSWLVTLSGPVSDDLAGGDIVAVADAGSRTPIGSLANLPTGGPELTSPLDTTEVFDRSPRFEWTEFDSIYAEMAIGPTQVDLELTHVETDTSSTLPSIPMGVMSADLVDPSWTGSFDATNGLDDGEYVVTLTSHHRVDEKISFVHRRSSSFVRTSDPCIGSADGVGAFILESYPLDELPRTVTCGPAGAWVHQARTGDVMSFAPDGTQGRPLTGVGEPDGNQELLVFHTFNSVEYVTDESPVLEPVLERDDSEYIADAAAFGTDAVLISTLIDIGLYRLDGSTVWTVPSSGNGRFHRGDTAWWVGDNNGTLYRIPLDGSPPLAIDAPRTVASVDSSRRDGIAVAPVEGGAWIANGDATLAFVSDEGELGRSVEVGPLFYDDGFHFVRGRTMVATPGALYAADADQRQWRVDLDSTDPAEVVPNAPFAEIDGLEWWLDGTMLRAVGDGGSVVFEAAHPTGELFDWAWSHGSLWLTDQMGVVVRVGPA